MRPKTHPKIEARVREFERTGTFYPDRVLRPQARFYGKTIEQWFFEDAYPVFSPAMLPTSRPTAKAPPHALRRDTIASAVRKGLIPCPPFYENAYSPTPGPLTRMRDVHPIRRLRSKDEEMRMISLVRNNAPRFFRAIPPWVFMEIDTRHALGLLPLPPRANGFGTKVKTSASMVPRTCYGCGETFYVYRVHLKRNPLSCTSRCAKALHAYAHILTTNRPPSTWRPVRSLAARLRFFFTKRLPYQPRDWWHIAAPCFRSLADIVEFDLIMTSTKAQQLVGYDTATREQQRAIGDAIAQTMATAMGDAAAVLNGTKKWDSNQTKLFLGLMNKMVPDAIASPAPSPNTVPLKPVQGMTREELAVLASFHPADEPDPQDSIDPYDPSIIDITQYEDPTP